MGFSTVRTDNIPANTKSANILAGDVNEFVSNGGQVNIYGVSSASGVRITVFADSDIVIDDKEIVSLGTTLDKSQHLFDSFVVEAGTRLSAFLRETAGVATTDILTGVEVS
jgi:hypothetical protein